MAFLSKNNDTRFILVVVLLAAIWNFSFLEYNNYLIRKSNPANTEKNARSLVYGKTVFSVDNEYYLSPVENYLSGKGWKRGYATSDGDYFRRVPGYSLIYLFFVSLFDKSTAFFALKIFQFLLFLSTIPAIYYLCSQVSGRLARRLATIVYAFVPFISSWTFYTLTESITPFLVVFYFFFLYKGLNSFEEKKKIKYYFLSSVFFAFGVLTRPYIAIAGLGLLFFAYRDFIFQQKRWSSFFYAACIAPAILIGAWTTRNYVLTKEFVPLEKAFHPQSIDRMKPEFRGLFSFVKCWGEDGFNLTAYHDPLFWAAVDGDTSSKFVTNILDQWPPEVVREYTYDTLFNVLKQHQELIYSFRSYIADRKQMPDHYLPSQVAMEQRYDGLIKEYKQKHFLRYWLITPLIYFKRLVGNSNTANLYFFQDENREKKYVNLYRNLLLLVHLSIYFALFLNIFLIRDWHDRLVFVLIPVLFVLFFSFIHREIEQRYMLPILPIAIAGIACVMEKVILFVNRRNNLKLLQS